MLDELNCLKKLFADDGKLYSPIRNIQDEVNMQGNVDNSEDWADRWEMVFSTKDVNILGIVKTNQTSSIQ